jgi:hypothetical protein
MFMNLRGSATSHVLPRMEIDNRGVGSSHWMPGHDFPVGPPRHAPSGSPITRYLPLPLTNAAAAEMTADPWWSWCSQMKS